MEHRIDVPYLDQTAQLPTGCESVSAVMLLAHLGVAITPKAFVDDCLEKQPLTMENGILRGPHPNDAFVGSPYGAGPLDLGCFAPAIAAALARAAGPGFRPVLERGAALPTLQRMYLDRGLPVLIWATLNLRPTKPGPSWLLPGGERFTWREPEHCMLLVGYDEHQYFCNDPWQNHGCVSYRRELLEKRYLELGQQALTLLRKEE